MSSKLWLLALLLCVQLAALTWAQNPSSRPPSSRPRPEPRIDPVAIAARRNSARHIRAHLEFLASDALQGRGSATPFERIAGQYIASQLRLYGIEPAGEIGADGAKTYLQTSTFPYANAPNRAGEKLQTWNVLGLIRGSDPKLSKQAVLLSAHMDHLGIGAETADGDNIYNGADDDASGVVAVLELARALSLGPKPKRTVIFVCFGSEEIGGYGARYFLQNPPMPLQSIVANLEFEMIGRSDAKVAANTLWLTGFERSNLGAELVKQGARLVADPHPEQNFFQRSDNYQLARRGVVAHTVSSYGLHQQYHQPTDDISRIDFTHMTTTINSLLKPIQWLVNSSFAPVWVNGGQP